MFRLQELTGVQVRPTWATFKTLYIYKLGMGENCRIEKGHPRPALIMFYVKTNVLPILYVKRTDELVFVIQLTACYDIIPHM